MIEVFALFKNYIVTHPVTENAMIASAYLTAWMTRYPHAIVDEARVKRLIPNEFGYEVPRQVTEIRIRINENVPDDLRA